MIQAARPSEETARSVTFHWRAVPALLRVERVVNATARVSRSVTRIVVRPRPRESKSRTARPAKPPARRGTCTVTVRTIVRRPSRVRRVNRVASGTAAAPVARWQPTILTGAARGAGGA